ncbi:MAG TPA: FkbM family methyltransferase [Alphaproteobacteria bacterium]|nr:FkbM family methyltransferase [Alphaproteobacteria bacterium]
MDQFWQAVADFLERGSFALEMTVAPAEFSAVIPIGFGYRNAGPAEAPRIKTLVLHKGQYKELDRGFMKQALAKLHPVFANEVFIVLSDTGQPLPGNHQHIGTMAAVRAWADDPSAPAEAAPVQHAVKSRIVPTYVGNDTVLVETLQGNLMVLPSADRAITPHMIRDGYFDIKINQFLERFIRPGMTYVDVGANVGVYAVIAAGLVGARGRVVCVEALPRLLPYLTDNFSMNGYSDRVQILPFAAADRDGTVTIHDFERYNGACTLVPEVAALQQGRLADTGRPIEIKARTLTSLLAEAKVEQAGLLKVDVEGFETEVLMGGRDFLQAHPDTPILIEWHCEFMSDERLRGLHGILVDQLGGRPEVIEANGVTRPAGFEELRAIGHADLLVRRGAGR